MSSDPLDSCLNELENTFSKLSKDKSNTCENLQKCMKLIEEIKDSLAKVRLSSEFMTRDHLLKMRKFFELYALVCLELNDTEGFKCAYSQLHPLYFDFSHLLLRSDRMSYVLSMWMLHLVSENKIGDLYMLLERIPADLKKDEKILFVINLERLMMEGNLGKLLDLNDNSNEYHRIIAATYRNKIASAMELSYKQLDMDYIIKTLKLKNKQELLDFISYYNQFKLQSDTTSVPWKVLEDAVVFQNDSVVKHKIPSKELLNNSLKYLNDLEKIV
ncbi:SAC3/GANP/Nin1/mts3/eIF-3 p25 family protein [Theileria parva strain Muguga]|uniref:SAC3/GANP/Nin1/mts3/eIF-3 p25 family protein n=1 Tax=Theileria parva strain Muguga TaxID=333668 RepID=UPI001C616F70|nr:SAC3/GANP/Nin1/mts3/eIF-3 p25 family protein [Theileria parva strain Muguga]EAN30782.2 SAC3/GANP/Nin1/mts3/eIF-3 p25 family protein [Theileria parva strain Muguga]